MSTSLATTTPNVRTMTADRVHQVRLGGRGFWKCYAKGCSMTTESMKDALRHVSRNQWTATGPLPPELQLSPEQVRVLEVGRLQADVEARQANKHSGLSPLVLCPREFCAKRIGHDGYHWPTVPKSEAA